VTAVGFHLQCFCQDQYEKFKFDLRHKVFALDSGEKHAICAEYVYDVIKMSGTSKGVAAMIALFNYIFKLIIVALIKRVRFASQTRDMKYIMTFTYFVQFLNTGILTVLSAASMANFDDGSMVAQWIKMALP